jgi:hypothetical protein
MERNEPRQRIVASPDWAGRWASWQGAYRRPRPRPATMGDGPRVRRQRPAVGPVACAGASVRVRSAHRLVVNTVVGYLARLRAGARIDFPIASTACACSERVDPLQGLSIRSSIGAFDGQMHLGRSVAREQGQEFA